jgi:hypothetical protein
MAQSQHGLTMRLVLFFNIPTYDSGEEFAALCTPEAAATDPLHAAGGQVKRLLPRNQFSRQLLSRHLIKTHPHLVRYHKNILGQNIYTVKTPNPKCRLFLKIYQSRYLAAGVYLSEAPSPPRFLFGVV